MAENPKAFLEELTGAQAPPLPGEVIEHLANKPDDEALYEFITYTLDAAVQLGKGVGFAAAAISNGVIDLGFKR